MNSSADLAELLRRAVLAQDFGATPDPLDGGRPLRHFPSIDLAVACFPAGGAPALFANVLFSRAHPLGLVAGMAAGAGALQGMRLLADQQDGQGRSIAWLPESDWQRLDWLPLHGDSGPTLVAPYPASLLKLMVLVGLAWLIDQGRSRWDAPVSFEGQCRPVSDWALDMTAISCNTATSALVAHLHAIGAIRRDALGECHNELHLLFAQLGLPTLRLANTRPDGGWGNAAGAGVGQLQMTAWDTVRLLWWLDPDAPAAPWLPARAPRLSAASRGQVLRALEAQTLRVLMPDSLMAELRFAHKTGTTENYASDAGIVRGIAPQRRHYLIAMLSNLGSRYGVPEARLAALGAAIDAGLKPWLESDS
ncbi:serine hydrolase [Paucibacter soli]|uniref:serine hydrolase n=1 Tax=Paucibacter soli TaxID=3133433 RepID=UPI0030A0E8FE